MSGPTAQDAWTYALNLLSRRSYTEAQLRERLARRGHEGETIDATLVRLHDYGFVDDFAFAEGYVRSRAGRKGPLALRRELQAKGVAEEFIQDSLEPLDLDAQLAAATRLLHKHAWRFEGGDPRRQRAKAFAFLARRGYPAEVAAQALERVIGSGSA